MEMRVLDLKDSVRAYHSVILVRADSDIQKLDDLRGSRIAFEDRGSTSGFFLPYVEMMRIWFPKGLIRRGLTRSATYSGEQKSMSLAP